MKPTLEVNRPSKALNGDIALGHKIRPTTASTVAVSTGEVASSSFHRLICDLLWSKYIIYELAAAGSI